MKIMTGVIVAMVISVLSLVLVAQPGSTADGKLEAKVDLSASR